MSPLGSVPGIWGFAEMTVWDKARNELLADLTEIVRFEAERTQSIQQPNRHLVLPVTNRVQRA